MSRLLSAQVSGFGGGMNDSAAVSDDFGEQEVAYMGNFRPDRNGAATVRGGSRKLHTVALLTTGGYQQIIPFEKANGDDQLVALVQGASAGTCSFYLSEDGGETWTLIDNSLSGGTWWDHATMRVGATNYLIFVNGSVAKKWDGGTITDLSGAPTAPYAVRVANARCWIAPGFSNIVYGSAIGDLETWTQDEGGVSRVVGGAEPIAALAEAPGGQLLILKRREVALADGVPDSEIVVLSGARGVSTSIGALHYRSVAAAGDQGVCWMSDRGLEFFDGESVQQIGLGVRNFLATADQFACATGEAWAVYHPDRNEVWFQMPTVNSAGDSAVEGCAVNLTTGASWRIFFSAAHPVRGACIAPVTLDGSARHRLVGLSSSGFAVALDTTDLKDDLARDGTGTGVEINGDLHGRLEDFRHPLRRKRPRFARVSMATSRSGGGTANVVVVSDGGLGTTHAATVEEGTTCRPYRFGVRPRAGLNAQARVSGGGGLTVAGFAIDASAHEPDWQGVR